MAASVDEGRDEMYHILYFYSFDGGMEAECLFLLEAPGTKAVRSGFVSRNNLDETAKNLFLLMNEAGIVRRRPLLWNIGPWYIGDGARIRAAKGNDIRTAAPALTALLGLLPALRVVALMGRRAGSAKDTIAELALICSIFTVAHPSPMFINRAPGNRSRILADLHRVAEVLGPADSTHGH